MSRSGWKSRRLLAAVLLYAGCGDEGAYATPRDGGDGSLESDAGEQQSTSDASASDDAGVAIGSSDAAVADAGKGGEDAALPPLEELPYARSIEDFSPGTFAGFGQSKLPEVVLGPPLGKGTGAGSLDVLSLGVDGEITLGFDYTILDGEGPDFIVFENPFYASGVAESVFAELGEVSVSDDGDIWHTFPCNTDGGGARQYPGCAGWTPSLSYDPQRLLPLDPELTGGDAFDLEDVGLAQARFVRIRDLATQDAMGQSGGFDLDAVGLIHYE
jgi:hypothetical protein